MSEPVTIMTFTFAHETGIVRSLLESYGIKTYVLNDYTAQTISLYSNAIGGVQVQVAAYDYDKAREILEEKGFLEKEEKEKLPSWIKTFKNATDSWPVFKNHSVEFRLFFLAAIAITIISVTLFLNFKFEYSGILSRHDWKVAPSFFNEEHEFPYHFQTDGKLSFKSNGEFLYQIADSTIEKGKWKVSNNWLELRLPSQTLTLTVIKQGNQMQLEAKNSSIYIEPF